MKTARKKPTGSARKRSGSSLPAHQSRSQSRSAALAPSVSPPGAHWTFLTNHGHVLVLLSRKPSLVLREVALQVGITERAVQRIIADLEAGGFIEREKFGRQNHYRIRADQPLRHPNESHRTVGELLALINGSRRALR
jgi:hypothetical protein